MVTELHITSIDKSYKASNVYNQGNIEPTVLTFSLFWSSISEKML